MSARVVLVGGGVRTGKSGFAVERALTLGARRAYVATAEALDDEMRERVAAHQLERGDAFTTVEEPHDLLGAIDRALHGHDVVLVDCLTLWLANRLLADLDEVAILAEVDAVCARLARRDGHVVLVTNEVGMGIVPDNALSRRYRDLAGRAHQRFAAVADELYMGAMGVLLRLRPAPVEVVSPGALAADGGRS